MEGVVVAGNKIPIWNYQKGIFKPAAFGRDGAALSIQTSVDSPYADVQDAETGEIAYKYRGTDPNHPDNVALRRAMEACQPLIYLIAVDPGFYDAILPVFEERHGNIDDFIRLRGYAAYVWSNVETLPVTPRGIDPRECS